MSKDWWLFEAGEYVLGTLRGPERDLFEKVMGRDADARDMVGYWEDRLAPLDLELERAPDHAVTTVPGHVWNDIERRLEPQSRQVTQPTIAQADDVPGMPRVSLLDLQGKLDTANRWLDRSRLVATLAIAAMLMGTVVLVSQQDSFDAPATPDTTLAMTDTVYDKVAVVSSEDGTELWMIVANESTGVARAIALDPPVVSDEESYQLWAVLPDEAGVASIGLLPDGSGASQTFELPPQLSVDDLAQGSAFAASLESSGGTDTGAPTGPVVGSGVVVVMDEPL